MRKETNKKLNGYEKKRNFSKTPEPKGVFRVTEGNYSEFVIHKHDASHLHFDLRLEVGGILKSWAVPKGISLDPENKNLAIMVEDHPFDYKDFEGIIPEGNYGAGTVMIWDRGAYYAIGSPSKFESERTLADGLEKGKISFHLEGKKIKGEFTLIRLKQKENNWLLIKKRDRYANRAIKNEALSAKTGRTMEEIANNDQIQQDRDFKYSLRDIELNGAPLAKMPDNIKPMLATLAEEPFNNRGWIFEIKWDGCRVIAKIDKNVNLYSRHEALFNSRFPSIVESLQKVTLKAVLDGEVVVLTPDGRADFQLLQNYSRTGRGMLVYYVFDILYLIKYDLTHMPLLKRKAILKEFVAELSPNIRFSDHVEGEGKELFEEAEKNGVEGIIGKDAESIYEPGIRSRSWVKVKTKMRQEAIICGFTEPRGGRRNLGALILGVYKNNELIYIGHTGAGISDRLLKLLRSKLEPLMISEAPFRQTPKTNEAAHWVRPELVCEIKFAEWTEDGYMRQPVFVGLRDDKNAEEITREEAKKMKDIIKEGDKIEDKRKINGATVLLTNLNKVYWPKENILKRDLIQYYENIAPVILPYLKDRPMNMHRFPNGINESGFYQKQADEYAPKWIKKQKIHSETENKDIDYILCQNKASLIYLANLGCIELNPWNSKIGKLDNPDYFILDIDPGEAPFSDAVQAALAGHEILEGMKIKNFCKTSGATGLHIFVPLGAKYNYDVARQFANLVCILINKKLQNITTLERDLKKRGKKVYLDYLQNRRGQTIASAYSVRPFEGAPVSTPLKWEEVTVKLNPSDFNMKNIFQRIKKVGDIWSGVLEEGNDLEGAMQFLEKKNKNRW